ncbi:hypothetical protein [Pontimicrobium sp. SW4]|uniref:HEAT repeat domain-containing protein n=1 Tax=Pontimicrobium sp. SW4 TaxID=3153519 RepID=A0AAU7BRV9_9FLAO
MEFEKKIVDYLSNNLSKKEAKYFEAQLRNDDSLKKHFEGIKNTWNQLSILDDSPEPNTTMDVQFYQMLEANIKSSKSNWFNNLILSTFIFNKSNSLKLAYAVCLIFIGSVIGIKVNKSRVNNGVSVHNELEQVVYLLNEPEVDKRLQGVSKINHLASIDNNLLNVLFKSLNSDSNVNVRLSILDFLIQFKNDDNVIKGLIESISFQDSPIIQMTLAELMMSLENKEGIEAIEKLIDIKKINPTVKEDIEKIMISKI